MEVENGVLEDVFSLQMGYFLLNHDYGRKGTIKSEPVKKIHPKQNLHPKPNQSQTKRP